MYTIQNDEIFLCVSLHIESIKSFIVECSNEIATGTMNADHPFTDYYRARMNAVHLPHSAVLHSLIAKNSKCTHGPVFNHPQWIVQFSSIFVLKSNHFAKCLLRQTISNSFDRILIGIQIKFLFRLWNEKTWFHWKNEYEIFHFSQIPWEFLCFASSFNRILNPNKSWYNL